MKRLLAIFGILACALLARSAPAQILYAAIGDDSGNGLYTVDPATAASTLVGPIAVGATQIGVTGLAIHPQTGVMYGVTTENPPRLVTIDPTTGNAAAVGFLGSFPVPDITFAADGTLYGWQKGVGAGIVTPPANASGRTALANPPGGLVTIDLTTGAASFVGTPSAVPQQGCGLTSLDGVLYLSLQLANGPLLTVNPVTGATAAGPTMNGPGAPIAALASSPSSVLYGATNNGALLTIDPLTGAVTNIGSLPSGTDALVFTNSALGGPGGAGAANVPSVGRIGLLALGAALALAGTLLIRFR